MEEQDDDLNELAIVGALPFVIVQIVELVMLLLLVGALSITIL